MNFVALRMLTGDRAKYLGLIFAIAFSSFLIAQQASIFGGLMDPTRSQIKDITDADIWVMDQNTQYFDEINALTDDDLYRVRGVSGVKWAVPLQYHTEAETPMKILIDDSGGFPAEPSSNDEPKWEPGRFPLHIESSGDPLGVLVFLRALPAVLHIGTQRGCPSRWWRS